MAPEVADQREVLARSDSLGQRQVVVDARDRLHAPAVAVRQPHAVDALGAADVGRAVAADRDLLVGRQPARHARRPTASLVADARGRRTGGSASARRGSSSTPACTPVISSSCDSLKSVVMCGCVSAEPSAAGCGVSARLPPGSARRLSFSMPRRMPSRRSGDERGKSGLEVAHVGKRCLWCRAKLARAPKTCIRQAKCVAPPPILPCHGGDPARGFASTRSSQRFRSAISCAHTECGIGYSCHSTG